MKRPALLRLAQGLGATALLVGGSLYGTAVHHARGGQPLATAPTPPPEARWVGAYWVAYEKDLCSVEQVDFSPITHLFVGRAVPHEDGTLRMDEDDPDNEAYAKELAVRAHRVGKKTLLMIGGAGTYAGFRGAAHAHRESLVQQLIALADRTKSDGLDLDWEPLPPEDEGDAVALLQDLHRQRPELLLTIPVEWGRPPTAAFFARVGPLLSQVNTMTYGMAGRWPLWKTWHSSALRGDGPFTRSSVERALALLLSRGVPRAKIGLGVGAYGTCWTGAMGPQQIPWSARVAANDGDLSFRNIVRDYQLAGELHRDEEARAPWLSFAAPHGPFGCRFVSYEDATSVAEKAAFARTEKLGGTMMWTLAQQHFEGAADADPLLHAMAGTNTIK